MQIKQVISRDTRAKMYFAYNHLNEILPYPMLQDEIVGAYNWKKDAFYFEYEDLVLVVKYIHRKCVLDLKSSWSELNEHFKPDCNYN